MQESTRAGDFAQIEDPMIVYTYRLTAVHEGYLAHCMETGVEAIGSQRDEAVEELRKVLTAAATRDEAIAPPQETPSPPKLILKEHEEPDRGPFGPGDTPAAEDERLP